MPLLPRLVPLFFAFFQVCSCQNLLAASPVFINDDNVSVNETSLVLGMDSEIDLQEITHPPELLSKLFNRKPVKNKKLIAALLAFPFPFGIVGLHRIYLGTSPHVPLVYIGTLGGGFGLIPLIDFIAILFEKDIEHYMNNNKVFMWIN